MQPCGLLGAGIGLLANYGMSSVHMHGWNRVCKAHALGKPCMNKCTCCMGCLRCCDQHPTVEHAWLREMVAGNGVKWLHGHSKFWCTCSCNKKAQRTCCRGTLHVCTQLLIQGLGAVARYKGGFDPESASMGTDNVCLGTLAAMITALQAGVERDQPQASGVSCRYNPDSDRDFIGAVTGQLQELLQPAGVGQWSLAEGLGSLAAQVLSLSPTVQAVTEQRQLCPCNTRHVLCERY